MFLLAYSCIVTPVFEELLFRGYIWNQLSGIWGNKWPTYLTTSILFGLWHLVYIDSIAFRVEDGLLSVMVWQEWYPTEGQKYCGIYSLCRHHAAFTDSTGRALFDRRIRRGIFEIPSSGTTLSGTTQRIKRNMRRDIFMRKMIAYCGLDCEKCDAYLATLHDDQALREKTAKAWSELNHVPILPEHINCLGCRADGIKTVFCDSLCEIRQCALKKGVETCGDCEELEKCRTVGAILADNPEALKNLKG